MAISHVILLLFENRPFDQILGSFKKIHAKLEGIDLQAPRVNLDGSRQVTQRLGAARILTYDPRHELEHVMVQLSGGNAGFVQDFAQSYPKSMPNDRDEIMSYYDVGELPAIHQLARNFTICDHWFSSVPGPTWCNRLFALSGTSLGRVAMPEGIMNLNVHWYDQPTLFDRLNEQKISWKVYAGDFPLSLLFVHQWEPQNATRYRTMTEFYRDVAGFSDKEPQEGGLPLFSFIEPSYCQPGANDAHPPHDIWAADALVANVYNAIRANEDLWNQTLLVIAFDEHGGLYDHVTPPAAVPPDFHHEEYTFNQLGLRVPVILVSPWVDAGVFQDVMDHTSLLKYLTGQWSLGPLGYRTANAATFNAAILGTPRSNMPGTIAGPPPLAPAQLSRQPETLNEHSSALVALSHVLESMAGEDANVVAARARQVLSGPQSQIDAAIDRVESFIKSKSQ
jgi:phospholipase C